MSQIKPRHTTARSKQEEPRVVRIFKRWVAALHQKFGSLPKGTTAALFRLIFPEEDAKRKYDMQEPRLIDALVKCFGLDSKRLTQWDSSEGSGCLGSQIRFVLEQSNSNEDSYITPLSIAQVDELLSELASLSPFSHVSVREKFKNRRRRTRMEIIHDLYRSTSPEDASYLTQIILKDLRPLLYPLEETHPTAALNKFNTKSVTLLTKVDAICAWDPSHTMLKACRVWSDLDHAAAIFEMPIDQRPPLEPVIGVMIDIPKSRKGQSCQHSLNFLHSSRRVWAETKYDGERTQIHVDIPPGGGKPHITIFSKSGRDSTLDRHAVHEVIREALGFSNDSTVGCIQHNVILDAEMVAFDGERVDEFWRIRSLIESTAYGVRRKRVTRKQSQSDDQESHSQASMMSDGSDTRHLGLVFFDILLLDSASLLSKPYHERRKILETVIQPRSGRAILANRFPVDMTTQKPEVALAKVFADHIADHQEGLVLKAEESGYNDYRYPWVKLKKDFVPTCGDTVDVVLVGASWEKERARQLRVGPNTLTTFYFGVLKHDHKGTRKDQKAHIEVIFTSSYGLSREHLEELNFIIRSSDSVSYPIPKGQALQEYTFNLYSGLTPPALLLREPLLADLFGAGFSKPPQCLYYELRWARITKVYRRSERRWKEGVDLDTWHNLACASVGRDKSDKEIDDFARTLFGKPCAPGAKCPSKRKVVAEEWVGKLLEMDGKTSGSNAPSSSSMTLKRRESIDEEIGALWVTDVKNPSDVVASPSKRIKSADEEMHKLWVTDRKRSGNTTGSPPKRRKSTNDEIDEIWAKDSKQCDDTGTLSSKRRKITRENDERGGRFLPLAIMTNTMPVEPAQSQSQPASSPLPASSQGDMENSQNVGVLTPGSSQVTAYEHQLPTPSSSSIRAKVKGKQRAWPAQDDNAVGNILEEAHVWVMRNGGSSSTTSCASCSKLKKQVSRDRRVHSIDSLLMACGWTEGVDASVWVKRGAIVVENHNPRSAKQLKELVDHLRGRLSALGNGQRKCISVMTCDDDERILYDFI